MDRLSASRPITLTWVRALMAGLGLSLLWSNSQERDHRSNSLPHGSERALGEEVAEPGPGDLYRADQRIIVAARVVRNRSDKPTMRALGLEMAQRYRQFQLDVAFLTKTVLDPLVSPERSKGRHLRSQVYGFTRVELPAVARAFTLDPASDAQEPPSFEMPSATDRMILRCLYSTLNAGIKSYDNLQLRMLNPQLTDHIESTLLQLRMDRERVTLLLRHEEDFSQAGDQDGRSARK